MIKKQEYLNKQANNYFWRTYDRKEIDFIEERAGKLYGYEIKWSKEKTKLPEEWLQSYGNAEYKVINKNNYLNFIV